MSAHKDFHRASAKLTSLTGSSHNRLSAHSPGSTSILPLLKNRSPAFMGEPPPGRPLVIPQSSQPTPLSIVELPQLVAKVGQDVAMAESMWKEGLGLMSASLAVDIPFTIIKQPQELNSVDEDDRKEKSADRTESEKERTTKCSPLTGTEVFEIFMKKRHPSELQFYYLKASEEGPYRPYDLRVVPHSKAGSDHYVFSPNSVIHVQNGCIAEVLTLAGWHREALLWKALRDIPLFRDYLLHKAFKRWQRTVRQIAIRRRRKHLQTRLLIAVPQFREALFHFTRLFEELKGVHWLPQDELHTYTLAEFQTTLTKTNQESRRYLERFFHYRCLILIKVQDTSYKTQQEIQRQVEEAHLDQCSQAFHLQQASTKNLLKELNQAEQVLQRLGSLAALTDCMAVQNLVTISQSEIVAFIKNVLKREHETQGSLFYAELTFGADGQLTLFPPIHLFHEVLLEAVLSVTDSILQVIDSYNKSCQDSKNSLAASLRFVGGLQQPRSSVDLSDITSTAVCKVDSNAKLVLPKLTTLRIQGHRLRGQYYPLTRKQLEWHLHHKVDAQEAEKEPARITQEAHREIQQLCQTYSWLVEARLFVGQWSSASLENMRGWSAPAYKKIVQKIQGWIDQVQAMPPRFITSNKLLTVSYAQILETLESSLSSIEKDVLNLISEELQLRTKRFLTDLEKGVPCLEHEPADLTGFANYASVVKHYKQNSAGMHQQLEYLSSLQTFIQLNCRNGAKEFALVKQTNDLWNRFVPLLRRAAETVIQLQPSMIITMHNTFSSLTKELEDLIDCASAPPYLDPNQNPDQVVAKLGVMCKQLHLTVAEVNELNRISRSLTGQPLDLTFVTTAQQNMEARKGLWELMGVSSAQIQEWMFCSFNKFVVSEAQDKVKEWLDQAASLARVIPCSDQVLQKTMQSLENFNQQLWVLAKLSSPTLKHKHWRNIFKGMGLDYTPELNLTVADLISKILERQDNMTKVCSEAQAEADMEQTFRMLQQDWEGTVFRITKFTEDNCADFIMPPQPPCVSEALIIMGLDALMAQTEDSVMTLSRMLLYPYACEFRIEAEQWVQLLQELEELLDSLQNCQRKWIFLSKTFSVMPLTSQKAELMEKFVPVDKAFRETIQIILSDPHVLSFVRSWRKSFQERNLDVPFIHGLKVMEEISAQLQFHLDLLRSDFPRLCFLSDGELIELLSQHPSPSSLLPLVCKCFRGVQGLEMDMTDPNGKLDQSHSRLRIKGVYGSLKEHLALVPHLEPCLNSVCWLGLLEQSLQQKIKELTSKCVAARQRPELERYKPDHMNRDEGNPSEVLKLIPAFPLQCLLVAEEVLWCTEVQKCFLRNVQGSWTQTKARNTAKLQSLCQAIRNIAANPLGTSVSTQHAMTALRAMVLLTIKHSQQVTGLVEVKGDLESSFEWRRLLTYHYSDTDEHSVYINALGKLLPYGNEYIGPENWMMVNTCSTERAFLGIVLALCSYRCAFVSGPLMSGKQQTVVQLGRALGRQVISLECCKNTTWMIVCQMLLGALQTGAWLVLGSVNSMEQGTLAMLGQHLADLHQSLLKIQENVMQDKVQRTKLSQMECQIHFEGKDILANLSYGCIVVSSNGYSAEIPENLRAVTRPVSLMPPDWTVFAEVLLTSLGFSKATSISRDLVSFLTLAKDLNCVPEFALDNPSRLVLLRKVIDASGVYLHRYLEETDNNGEKTYVLEEHHNESQEPQECTSKLSVVNPLREQQAIVKGIVSVLLPAFIKHSRALHFCTVLEEMFPAARCFASLQHIEESQQNILRHALTKELQQTGFWPDAQILDDAVTLHQALKFSQAVVLVGPAGSGKTTLCTALSGALRHLAAKEDVANTKLVSHSCWYSVQMAVLFPNALSHEEFFGGYNEQTGSWWDGVFTKMLRSTKGYNKKIVKWLVLDGEPLSDSGWFDSLSTLGNPENPFLYLSSGEKVQPSQESFKILVETTSLKNAAPSALTRCSLVCISGTDLWKAVWKAELDALYKEHALDQSILEMWSSLAEELFSSTIIFLRHKALTTVTSGERHEASTSSHVMPDGLQEVMSFIKILRALLGEPGNGSGFRTTCKQNTTESRDLGPKPPSTELRARNTFVLAYIWGFGGRLHPRHWPQFDLLARDVLFSCRYKIEVPHKGTVFEHFFNLSDEIQEDATSTSAVRVLWNRGPLHYKAPVVQVLCEGNPGDTGPPLRRTDTLKLLVRLLSVPGNLIDQRCPHITEKELFSWSPLHEKCAYLLDRLLEANQPALLVGETGSGKTTLCKYLLEGRPHVHLHSFDLRNILESMGNRKDPLGTVTQNQRLHFFVDDIHEAPFEATWKISQPLETLRQCISKNEVLNSKGYYFKPFCSGETGFLGTCSLGSNTSQISPRLTRLFTILVLPSMTVDILFSFHSTQLEQWLRKFPSMPRIADLAHCIVTATSDVYHAVSERLPSARLTPHVSFSLHDLQKVFQGMRLWKANTTSQLSSSLPALARASLGPVGNLLSIGCLWMHECLRTFGDRLSKDEERQILVSVLTQASERNFGSWLGSESQTNGYTRTMDDFIQDQGLPPINQMRDDHIPFNKGFTKDLGVEMTRQSKSIEKSECPNKQSSSDSSFSDEERDEDHGTGSSNRKKDSIADELESESEPSTSPHMPQLTDNVREKRLSDHALKTKNPQATPITPQWLMHAMRSIHFTVFSPDLGELNMYKAQRQFIQNLIYQETDLDALVQQLTRIVKIKEEEESNHCKPAPFVIYRQRARQLAHVLRAILIPGGHGVLFGAAKNTCRKTTVRLAAYLTGCTLIEIHRGNEGKVKEILKEAQSQMDTHVVFIIHEEISQAIRDELLVIMASRTFPGLHSEMELKDVILDNYPDMKNSQNNLRRSRVKEMYFRNSQRNIHMFLLLPLNQDVCEGETVSESRIAKALKLCCCVEVYQPWTFEDLVDIGSLHLKYSPQITKTTNKADKTLVSIAQAMAGIHQSATKYASTLLKVQPFGPQTYIELISYIYHISHHLYEQDRGQASRLAAVLARLKDMTDTAEEYRQTVFRLSANLEEIQKILSQLQREVDAERALCESTYQRCLLEQGRLSRLEEQLDQAEQRDQNTVKELTPLYQAALMALQSLNQSDLDELRRYRHPPDGVVRVINAICTLFSRPCNWESGKHLLGQPNFLQELEFFDRSKLSDELFEKLGHIVQAPTFQPHLVRDVSQASESLCRWVHAVYRYACAQRNAAPLEAHKNQLRSRVAETRARLRDARLQEEAARDRLENAEKQLQLMRCASKEVGAQLRIAQAQEKQAADALKRVRCHAEKWNAAQEEIEINYQNISGDALLLAAAIAYLGPFEPDARQDLLEKWHRMCLSGRINVNVEDPRISLHDGPQIISYQEVVPIPVGADVYRVMARVVGLGSSNLVVKLLLWAHGAPWAHRWPLLAETQEHQELSTLQTGHFSINDARSYKEEYELVVPADDPELLHKIRQGAKKGLKMLVTQFERAVPSVELLNLLLRPAGSHFLSVAHTPEPECRLFLSSALPARALMDEMDPSLLAKVNMIDLSLSTSEVQSIILTDLMKSECFELWVHRCQMQREKQVLQDKLHLEEASLMEYIQQCCTPLLEDPEFLPHVSERQGASQRLQAEIEELSSEINGQTRLLNHFGRIAALATDLFKALQDVGHLSPFYFFPLCKFLTVIALKHRPDLSSSVLEISQWIVSQLLASYRPCLFQNHAELLRLLTYVVFSVHNEGCSDTERVAFLKGLGTTEHPEPSAPELPNWIPPSTKSAVGLLEKIPSFRGLASSLRNSSRLWQEYFHFPSATVVGPVPCRSHSHLTIFQRAILWKVLCPQWLAAVANDLFACQQGRPVRLSVPGDPDISAPETLSCFLSRNEGPVIVTSAGLASECPLHRIKQVALHEAGKKGAKVTVISFGSKCQRDAVLSSLHTAVQTGSWLVFDKCHLLDHWDDKVVNELRQLISCTIQDAEVDKGVGNLVPPNFRLWFVTNHDAPQSIPAFVRMRAFHWVCDSDRDLKDELCSSLRELTRAVLPTDLSQHTDSMRERLLRSATLHSVLMQRQKLKHLGHGKVYKWALGDLLALIDAQVQIGEQCNDPTGALEYIAAYLVYGGHVSDSADMEVLETACRVCLRPPPPTWGSGPHTLSDTISRTGCTDEDLLKTLCRAKLNWPDPVLLGLSTEMTGEIMKLRSQTLSNLLVESQGGRDVQEFPDLQKAQKRLGALLDRLERRKESNCVDEGTVSPGSLRIFLQTELENLTDTVSSLLEAAFQSPQVFGASPYTRLISELETRADLLQRYGEEETKGSPGVYCLSVFANPRGFLAAVIRETVLAKQRDISQMRLHFQVVTAVDSPVSTPSSGIYLSGLELHGALWDTKLGALQDTLSPEPCAFPLLWVRALKENEDLSHTTNSPPSISSSTSLYSCPLYVHRQSEDGQWSLSADNILTRVPLATRLDPAFCTLRRVRLVSRLKENR